MSGYRETLETDGTGKVGGVGGMPTKAEAERLVLLIEECGEVVQAASKILRHGWHSEYDDGHGRQVFDNQGDLEREIGHVFCAAGILAAGGDVEQSELERHGEEKLESVWPYLHHQPKEVDK